MTFDGPGGKRKRAKSWVPSSAPWLMIDGGWNDLAAREWLRGIAVAVMADSAWNQ